MAENHGNTPAAWTAVCILIAGFIVAGVGAMMGSWLWFWIGAAFEPVGVAVGVAMSKAGLGARH